MERMVMKQMEMTAFALDIEQMIRTLVKNYERCEQMCLAQQGVTVAQAYTLLTLPQAGQITMNELSAKMGLASSTMTRMIDQLVTKGLVQRQHDEEDRRVVWVKLTAKGQRVQHTLDRAQRELFEGSLNQISEEERARILHALKSLNDLFERGLEGCGAGNE
jgi:DNA-binding MarR family transcriptional regulator